MEPASEADRLYLYNDYGGFSDTGTPVGSETDVTYSVVLGDMDRDGDTDLVTGNSDQINRLYRSAVYRTSSQTVVSLPVNDGVAVSSVGLIATDTVNTAGTRNTAIDYFLSNDGGAHWYRVYSGKGVVFPSAGTDLRWKAGFSTLSPAITPALHQVIIDRDTDMDGITDYADTDDDNDNLSDIVENQLGTDPLVFDDQSQPLVGIVEDTDGDGLTNDYEINFIGTDPDVANTGVAVDTDLDGLTDDYEINVSGTDPNVSTQVHTGPAGDINGDGVLDVGDLLRLQRVLLGLE